MIYKHCTSEQIRIQKKKHVIPVQQLKELQLDYQTVKIMKCKDMTTGHIVSNTTIKRHGHLWSEWGLKLEYFSNIETSECKRSVDNVE